MKQQTAMTEMLSWISSAISSKEKFPNEVDINFNIAHLKEVATELLQKEEEQIKNAYRQGCMDGGYAGYPSLDEYFNQTYNNNG